MIACNSEPDYPKWPKVLEDTDWNNPFVAYGAGSSINFVGWGRVGISLYVGVPVPDYELVSVNGKP